MVSTEVPVRARLHTSTSSPANGNNPSGSAKLACDLGVASAHVKRTTRYVGVFGFAAILIITAGALYHSARSVHERGTYPPPGRIVRAGTIGLHIHCSGSGSPTAVLESGAGASSNIWALVQDRVAQRTRVCSYDRAGYAWSDDPPLNGHYDRIEALRDLLSAAGERGRYVFVGHSLGGEFVRIHAYEHPEDVAGLVLIATSHPDVFRRDPEVGEIDEGPDAIQRVMPVLAATGLFRMWPEPLLPDIYRDYLDTLRKLPPEYAAPELAFVRHTRYHRTVVREMESMVEMRSRNTAARSFGDTPLIVISERWDANPADPKEVAAARLADQLQSELAGFSNKGRRFTLDGGHVLPIVRSEQVSTTILEVVANSRQSGRR